MTMTAHRFQTGRIGRGSSGQPRNTAFTLTELLVVMAIIALIVTLMVPVTSSMINGSRLNAGISQIVGGLHQARQAAIARNHTIEVRFYKYADMEAPGESVSDESTWKFRGYQLIEYLDNGAPSPLGKVEVLPKGILFDSGGISTLLAKSREKTFSAKDPQLPVPGVGDKYECRYFQFMPSGFTDLGMPAKDWYVTVHREVDGDKLATPPPDYGTIQIDSISGSARLFRPGL